MNQTAPDPAETPWVFIPDLPDEEISYPDEDHAHTEWSAQKVLLKYPSGLMDFAGACFAAFAIVGLVGNLVSIMALSKSRKLRNPTTAFLVNLSVADLVFGCISVHTLSSLTFLEQDWDYGDTMCKILVPLVKYSKCAVSLLSVIAIGIERYVLSAHPSVYSHMYSFKKVAFMIFLMWTYSLALGLIPTLLDVWERFGYEAKMLTCRILELNGQTPTVTMFTIAFGLPSLIFVVGYYGVFSMVRRLSTKTIQQDLKVILVIFLAFVLCYFPVTFLKIFTKEDDMPVLNILGYIGIYFSNIVNPVIYVVSNDEYRKAYVDLLIFSSPARQSSRPL